MQQQHIQTINQVATTGRRFMNYVIDSILYEIGMFILINPLVRLIFGDFLYKNIWSSYLFASLILFFYYFIFEAIFQKTPGKFITGTKVVMMDGSKPDIATIAKRTLSRLVPFEVFSMYTGKEIENKGTWWHDRWAATRVVQKTSRPEKLEIENAQLVPSPSEHKTSSYGVRLLIIFGIVFLGCITMSSGGSLLMLVISSITVGTRLTGNFWEDIFPFILMIVITGIGLFGIFKLVQVLRKKA
jgi:uncharacterized RDD family membrane protein YckC